MAKSEPAPQGARVTDWPWYFPHGILLVALLCLAGGADSLWHHVHDGGARPFRLPCALVLMGLACAQFWILSRVQGRSGAAPGGGSTSGVQLRWDVPRSTGPRASRAPFAATRPDRPRQARFWRFLLLGCVISYLACVFLNAGPYVRYLFRALLAGWYTLGLLPLVASRQQRERLSLLGRRAGFRRAEWIAFGAALLFVVLELGIRSADFIVGERISEEFVARTLKLAPGSKFHGRTVNGWGYWDDEFEPLSRPGRYRIAALGRGVPLSGVAKTNCLDQLEERVPGIEIYNFGIPRACAREYAAQAMHDVAHFHPDLVLTFVSVGDDLAPPTPLPDRFDWYSLRMVQLGTRSLGLPVRRGATILDADYADYESYLRDRTPSLAVCRTPIDPSMRDRWQETFRWLELLVEQCRRREMRVALVIVPDEFQVSTEVCEVLRRRAGYKPEQLDLGLPQRRLQSFADSLDLPVLDLLPNFQRASGTWSRHGDPWTEEVHAQATEWIGAWLQTRFGAMIAANTQAANGASGNGPSDIVGAAGR